MVELESLKHRLGPGLEEDYKLCPVRTLRYYLERTKGLREKGNSQLFVSLKGKEKRKAVTKNTVASWIKQTVKKAYEDCTEEVRQSLKITAHEVRALATSTAFYGTRHWVKC